MILLRLVALLTGLACLYPSVLMVTQPRQAGQDYNPFDLIVGILLGIPSVLLIWLAFAKVT